MFFNQQRGSPIYTPLLACIPTKSFISTPRCFYFITFPAHSTSTFRVRSNFRIWFHCLLFIFIFFLLFCYFFLFFFFSVRFGTARFGSVRSGSVRSGPDRIGSVRSGSVRFGSVRIGSVRIGSILKFHAGFPPSCHSLSQLPRGGSLLALVSESNRVPCALLWAPAPRLRSSQCASDSQQRVKTHP